MDEQNNHEDYEVGYGKPPKKHQWKKGHSGNPKGKVPGVKNLKTLVDEMAHMPCEIMQNGKKTKSTVLAVTLRQMAIKATQGDLKAATKLISLVNEHGTPPEPTNNVCNTEDEIILNYWHKKSQSGATAMDNKEPEEDDHDED